jgi:hypothetical protein
MHPLRLLLSITFCTILAIHRLTDTIISLRTDAAGCATAGRRASSSICCNMSRRIGLKAYGRAKPTLFSARFTGPRPPRKPESSEYAAVLRRRQMTWPARPGISAHCARETSASAQIGLAYASNLLVPPFLPGVTITCDPQVRIPGQDAFK